MADGKNMFSLIVTRLALIIFAVFALAMAANHFVRVPDPADQASTGIVVNWFENLFKSENLENWEKSVKFSGYGMDILFRHGPAMLDSPSEEMKDQKDKAIAHLSTALEAAERVEDSYLDGVHPQLPAAYRNYKRSLALLIKGAKESDIELFNQANALYNDFIAFLKEHYQEFKPLE